jgi:hypothetical protein
MSSRDETETWQPKPPDLLPPWHTSEREELQLQARRFAMDEVLPVANELDPQKGEIPASLLDRLAELGYFGITVPTENGGLGQRGAGPCVDVDGQHPGPFPGPRDGGCRRRAPGRADGPQRAR